MKCLFLHQPNANYEFKITLNSQTSASPPSPFYSTLLSLSSFTIFLFNSSQPLLLLTFCHKCQFVKSIVVTARTILSFPPCTSFFHKPPLVHIVQKSVQLVYNLKYNTYNALPLWLRIYDK